MENLKLRNLLLGVLDQAIENASNQGCNDLFEDNPLLQHLTVEEKQNILHNYASDTGLLHDIKQDLENA